MSSPLPTAFPVACPPPGLPVLTAVLSEEREDVEMVRGALEALINALVVLTPQQGGKAAPGRINAELFAREAGSVQLLLSLLQEEDFYVRYHTVQLLTVLLQNSPGRLVAQTCCNATTTVCAQDTGNCGIPLLHLLCSTC